MVEAVLQLVLLDALISLLLLTFFGPLLFLLLRHVYLVCGLFRLWLGFMFLNFSSSILPYVADGLKARILSQPPRTRIFSNYLRRP